MYVKTKCLPNDVNDPVFIEQTDDAEAALKARLGQWVSRQRQNKATLSLVRRQRLDELGFIWDEREADWEEGFNYLKAYEKREGHCNVPRSHKENGFRLGQWVTEQRNKETMSSKRRQALDELGFIWDLRVAAWENGFSYLKIYKDRNGHCQVPKTYKENGFELGSWVSVQRVNKNQMSSERRQRLDELDFVWKPQKGPLPRIRQNIRVE